MDFTLKHCLLAARFLKMRQGNEETTCSVEQSVSIDCMYIFTWQDLAQVIVAHPKVGMFMDIAFRAVHQVVRFLQNKLSTEYSDISPTAESAVNYLCQQYICTCLLKRAREREREFISEKETEMMGGILFLAQSVLKLHSSYVECSTVMAALSRMKAKVLSILLHLCEAESISYLDEVASSQGSLDLAKAVALEVLELLEKGLSKDPKFLNASSDKTNPVGLLQLNAMRLVDILSDDSNFRSYITVYFVSCYDQPFRNCAFDFIYCYFITTHYAKIFLLLFMLFETELLSAIFSLSRGDFLSMWCSADLPVREEDATLCYELFPAAGWALDSVSSSNTKNLDFSLSLNNSMSQASYVH
ncbi:hypothetical protein PTKIN_Ptkin14bG0008000 [Pterospermum kingtungense]